MAKVENKVWLAGYMLKTETAGYLRVSVQTLSKLMRKGKVPFHKLSRKLVLFRKSEVDAALDRVRVSVGK